MNAVRTLVMLVVLALVPLGAALAQGSDQPDAMPDEAVRAAQQALRDQGYYQGPLDGLLTLELRRAV